MTYKAQIRPLTTGIDNLTGGDGNDTFNAPLVVNEFFGTNDNTLNSGDQVNGGDGNNTLNAVLNNGAIPVIPVLTNVQTVNVQSIDESDLDLSASTGVEQININGVVAGTNIDGVQDANVAISNLKGLNTNLALGGIEGREFTLGLNNVGAAGADRTVKVQLDAGDVRTLTIDNGDKASFVDLSAPSSSVPPVSPDLSALRTVEATGDGNLNVDLSVAAALRAVTTGAGDDKVVVDNGTFTALAGSIDLGEGNNTLVVNNAAAGLNLSQNALNADTNARVNAELNGVDTLELVKGTTASWTGNIALKDSGLTSLVLNGENVAGAAQQSINAVVLKDAAKSFTLGLENVVVLGSTVSVEKTENLTLNVKGGAAAVGATLDVNSDIGGTPTDVKLNTLSINDTAKDGGLVSVILAAADDTTLRTINLAGEENTDMTVNASGIIALSAGAIANPELTVNIGNFGGLKYEGSVNQGTAAPASDTGVIEVFKFTADDFGKIAIKDFEILGVKSETAGNAAIVNDKIDLSGLGITGFADLNLESVGGNMVITAADGQFTGEITLTGVVDNQLTVDNFDFA